jgi:uncharacterized protein (DUF488 family)
MTIWTIGHSSRPLETFLELLSRNAIEAIADVRRFPGSRRQPQYGQAALGASLAGKGVEYRWIEALGGRRRPRPDSANTAWRNPSFRGYADYMESAGFRRGMDELLELAARKRTAMMCSEAMWWRCHRSLVSDALCAREIEVMHILDAAHTRRHPLTAPARIVGGRLSYAA